MIENVLSDIGGIGVYGVISICIFFTVFVGAVVWMLCLKKPYLNAMSALPLEDEAAPANPTQKTNSPENHHE